MGFIGLGTLGRPMARNLVQEGFEVGVYDVDDSAVRELERLGATGRASARDVAVDADYVFSMVRDAAQTEAVVLGERGIQETVRAGATVIVTSTIGPASMRKIGLALEGKGVRVIDAPVSGSIPGAQQGTLTLMVGADVDVLDDAMPVLGVIGKHIIRAGGVGAGQIAKLASNLVFGVTVVGLLEGLSLGIAGGIEPETLKEIFRRSAANSFALEEWHQLGARFKGAFCKQESGAPASNLCKDLGMAIEIARGLGVPVVAGAVASALCGAGIATGHRDPRI